MLRKEDEEAPAQSPNTGINCSTGYFIAVYFRAMPSQRMLPRSTFSTRRDPIASDRSCALRHRRDSLLRCPNMRPANRFGYPGNATPPALSIRSCRTSGSAPGRKNVFTASAVLAALPARSRLGKSVVERDKTVPPAARRTRSVRHVTGSVHRVLPIRSTVEEVTSPDDMPETSYATRAKLTMQTPSEESKWTEVNPRVRVLKERKHLLVSNTGPKRDGYTYCVKCGRIEATSEPTPLLTGPHRKPYPDEKEPTCEGAGTTRHIVLGTDFITDIALFSMSVEPPFRLSPASIRLTSRCARSVRLWQRRQASFWRSRPGELMAEYRPSLTPEGRDGLEAEIFLYDTLPGGAGFASQLVDRGPELFQRALKLMKTCPENCDASCYRCLRSFKNKFEHRLLDRHVGAELVEYLLTGNLPEFDAQRLQSSTTLLYNDLLRQGLTGTTFEAGVNLTAAGGEQVKVPILVTGEGEQRFIVALSGPLTNDHPAESAIPKFVEQAGDLELIVVNELLVRGNLPAATREVRHRLGV